MSRAETEYSKLVFAYAGAVEIFVVAVDVLSNSKSVLEFRLASEAVNQGRAKCEVFRERLRDAQSRADSALAAT
jgi:hypothetical protein